MKHPKTILVADDDQAILESIKLLLEMNDYSVITSTGDDIFSLLKTHTPDVVLLDIWMGNIDGKALCQKIKANATTAHIPIMMVSASSDISATFSETGASDFIEKPFDIDVLMKKIESLT